MLYPEDEAYRVFDKLIRLGGRPTRAIRPWPSHESPSDSGITPSSEAAYTAQGHKNKSDPEHNHWSKEYDLFRNELDRWQAFRATQTDPSADSSAPDFYQPPLGDEVDRGFLKYTNSLRDWRAFRCYQNSIIYRLYLEKEHYRREITQAKSEELWLNIEPTYCV